MGQVFSMRFDARPLASFFSDAKKSSPVAIARAINRTVKTSRTDNARAISKDMGISVAVAREQQVVSNATPTRLSGFIIVTGKRIKAIDLKARGPEPSRGRGRGVSYIGEGGKRKRYDIAFITRTRSGHRGVFARAGKTRLPVFEVEGASIATVFAKLIPLGEAKRLDDLKKNLQRELNFVGLSTN